MFSFLKFGLLGVKTNEDDITPAGADYALLLENGSGVLLEDGSFLLLEGQNG